MTLGIYVMGSSAEPERVRAAMDRIKAHPRMRLTLDWLAQVEAARARGAASDSMLPIEVAREHALADLRAVRHADVAWLLAPETPTRGAWAEFGFALTLRGWHEALIVSGPERDASIFTSLAPLRVPTDAHAFALIQRMAEAG